jgi:hypothetical protein
MALSLALALGSMSLPAAAETEPLGISVEILPRAEDNQTGLKNDIAWFAMEPGESNTRTFSVESYSSLDQKLKFELLDFLYVDGEKSINTQSLSKTSEWFSVAETDMVVPAGETRQFNLTFAVPISAEERSFEGVLRVLASGIKEVVDTSEPSSTQADLVGRMAIAIPFWLGVGDALDLLPDFEILAIEGLRIDGDPYLQVEINNTGSVPIFLEGSAQFVDPLFEDRVFEPVDFRLSGVPVGSVGSAQLKLNPEITDGEWRVLVAAGQAQVRKTNLFEGQITFRDPDAIPIWWPAVQISLITFFLIVALFSLLALRKKKKRAKQGRHGIAAPTRRERHSSELQPR